MLWLLHFRILSFHLSTQCLIIEYNERVDGYGQLGINLGEILHCVDIYIQTINFTRTI